ncbi:MAG TPA: Rne/Rng family ribonuclease [Nocardioides sp.]|uniref:Rne/Rng family ribonuclease n=1 Tax=Nocardioides sp. TaxID=35761 RepID=UPI002F4107A1
MLDDHADASATPDDSDRQDAANDPAPAAKKATRKRTTKKAAPSSAGATAKKATAKKAAAKKAAAPAGGGEGGDTPEGAEKPKKRSRSSKATAAKKAAADEAPAAPEGEASEVQERSSVAAVFQAPDTSAARGRRTAKKASAASADEAAEGSDTTRHDSSQVGDAEESGETPARRKRRRGGRRRRKPGGESGETDAESTDDEGEAADAASSDTPEGESTSSRRRRRRRRAGEDGGDAADDPAHTVTKVRSGRSAADEITAVSGSTRLEAKKQRRREGREAGRRRAPIVSEAEFLARRESVNRVMVIRQHEDVTQIGVLEDNVLVEHYVARESQTSLIGNVYLGRVQNVLPSMEAAFIDIGKGRNAVLYAGEVNWSALGHKDGQPRKIESVLSSGQTVLVQVTKDPIGHKGARLTSQISLAGRFLVYVPDGTTSGISRKLPDTERNRLKTLLKEIVPEQAGVIVRTAAEGAAEDELTRDVERLKARWDDIEKKAANKGASATLLYGEPDLTLKVVRDLFTEDFTKLVIEGEDAWETVQGYVAHVAPDLGDRLERYEPKKDQDVFAAYRIDEQIKKGLDRKVWLPSGGSLIIDRTEAMTVIDVNTGKFTGSGGNLEETVTKNNLEAAEEIVRQLRLRDIGGIIVVDFIDMVLESNRDLVLRRLVECLGRDRTRHQVAEVTSLGLVQMTRKRIGTGLLESFSHDCPTCHGRGVVIEDAPVEPKKADEEPRRARRSRSRGRGQEAAPEPPKPPSPKDVAAMARHHEELAEEPAEELAEEPTEEPAVSPIDPVDSEQTADASPVVDEAEVETEPDVETDLEPELEPTPPAEPEKPRVVTRTRRRAASRPAGPPASATGVDGAAEGTADVAAGVAVQTPEEPPALHVPVKRKGARKR